MQNAILKEKEIRNVLIYALIFISKIVEVSLATVRTVLLTRGEKLLASIIGFFEVFIWLMIVGNVLVGIKEDPFRMFAYAFGFACGNFVGSTVEESLAIGLITINITVSEKDTEVMAELIRKADFGVTKLSGSGLKDDKTMLIVYVKRKRKDELINIIKNSEINALISVSNINTVYGGYGIRK